MSVSVGWYRSVSQLFVLQIDRQISGQAQIFY